MTPRPPATPRPGGGTRGASLPLLLLLPLPVLTLASLAGDLSFAAFFLATEAVVAWCTFCQVALERHSRADLVERATAEGQQAVVLQRLAHHGAYELAVRLLRFLGSMLLVAGIAWLVFRDHLDRVGVAAFPWGPLVWLVGITFGVQFVLNEVVLRLVARRQPEAFLLRALPALEALRIATAPLRLPLVWAVQKVFRVPLQGGSGTAREEVLESVEEAEREGSFTADEADMIESILDLDRVTVADVMTARGDVSMLPEDATLEAALEFVLDDGHSRIPVYGRDRDDVLGVLYVHDLLRHLGRPGVARHVRDVMRPPFFVPESKPLNDLLAEMRVRKVHLAVVLNEFGATAGVATIEDLLEEIVGDIEDEYDEASVEAPRVEDGALVVDGRTPIEDVNRALSVALPVHDDFETVGGLVFHELGKVPKEGDELQVENVAMTVTEADERTARRLRLRVLSEGA